MIIDQYYNLKDRTVSFTREQGSGFAKNMAHDFNPLHDVDAKRFCIPGDLLFSVILANYGISRHMEFTFSGMVIEGVELLLPEPGEELQLQDSEGREYLSVKCTGDTNRDETLIQNITQHYVEFSGQTFPHILVPLLAEQGVMINMKRPMVIYASMVIDLDRLDIVSPRLEPDTHTVQISGKRGTVDLGFHLVEDGDIVGRGSKHMLLSGLREYDEALSAETIAHYDERKRTLGG